MVAMATTKGLSLICEIPNFAYAYLGKVTMSQGHGLFRFQVLSNLLAWRWKTAPSPGMNRVNPEHSITFAKALAKINIPEDYVRNPDRIDSIRWYRNLQDSQAPGPSFVTESVEAPIEVARRTPKSPTASALVYGKWLNTTR